MLKSVKLDLEDLCDAMNHLDEAMAKLKLAEKIDVAARLKAVTKTAEKLDKAIKDEIKAKRKNKAGEVLGEVFKAVLAFIPTERLDQKALKEAEPVLWDKYKTKNDEARITFEAR